MTTSKRDLQALHYLAQRLRADTLGASKWDDNGLHAVLARLEGHNLAITIERVTRHAADPEARTPAAIERPFVPDAPGPQPRFPSKAGSSDECRLHPGQPAANCGGCAADRLAGNEPTPPRRERPPADVAHRGAAACRVLAGLPVPSPEPDVASESAVDDAARDDPGRPVQDVQQRAGEPDRPEAACLADGCYRPTTQGICDRCRAQAIRDDEQAANRELVDRLHANQRARAHTRPEPSPEPPRHFTSADINHERVRAAMTQAATERTT